MERKDFNKLLTNKDEQKDRVLVDSQNKLITKYIEEALGIVREEGTLSSDTNTRKQMRKCMTSLNKALKLIKDGCNQ